MDWALSTGAARGDFSSPLETGKSTGGGGVEELYSDYAAAAPKVSFGPEVGIVCLPIADIGLPGMICGGLIGSKNRMCCKSADCEVALHAERKAIFRDMEEAQQIFIMASGRAGMVHLQPRVGKSLLGDKVERYLTETRSLDAWVTLFDVLKASNSPQSDRDVVRLVERIDDDERTQRTRTPMKKKSKLDVTSPALEAGYEVTMLPLTRSMPMEDGEMMQILRLEWGTLASTLDTLKDMVSGCRDMSKGMHKFQIPVSFDNNVISDHVQCPGQRGPA